MIHSDVVLDEAEGRWARFDETDLYPFLVELPSRVARPDVVVWLVLFPPTFVAIAVFAVLGFLSALTMSVTLLVTGRRYRAQVYVARKIVTWATGLLFFATVPGMKFFGAGGVPASNVYWAPAPVLKPSRLYALYLFVFPAVGIVEVLSPLVWMILIVPCALMTLASGRLPSAIRNVILHLTKGTALSFLLANQVVPNAAIPLSRYSST